jgi:hypothetical protein
MVVDNESPPVCKDCDPAAYMAAKRGDVRAAEQAQQRRGQDERPKELHYWPWCATCRMPFAFDNDEPFAHCGCGTTEWGDPRPAPWVTAPVDRQRLQEEVQSMLRKAAEAFAAEVEQSFITGSKRTTQPAAAPDRPTDQQVAKPGESSEGMSYWDPMPSDRQSAIVPQDDLPLEQFTSPEHECEFMPMPNEDEESTHFLRRCPTCKKTWWSLHCRCEGVRHCSSECYDKAAAKDAVTEGCGEELHMDMDVVLTDECNAHVASDIENAVLREALTRIANKDGWARKYPQGNYECIAVDCIGIARDALRMLGVKT